MKAIVMWFCTDCLAGNCIACLERGRGLDDGSVCECEHDDLITELVKVEVDPQALTEEPLF